MPLPFVDLKRRFREWHPASDVAAAAVQSYTRLGESAGTSYDWKRLCTERRAIILAEPGSGKTREMQEAASRLQHGGKTAFFIRLDRLVAATLQEVLAPTPAAEFERWLKSEAEAFFFLDSVDEAKLTRSADFYVALARFSKALGSNGGARARIFLSSRVSEWCHDVDYPEVSSHLGDPVQRSETTREDGSIMAGRTKPLLVVKLEPFDRDEALTFARAIGTREADRFVAAIDAGFAWEFARRPLDVIDLAKFWSETGRLGTLTEIVRAHVRRNLRENPDRELKTRNPLSEADALQGSHALAAATVLCQQTSFDVSGAGDGLDATSCLPADWPNPRAQVMLSRPLFDDASYGKRQFHHRRAVEFLAADWMAERMAAGCTLLSLRNIFFEAHGDGMSLRPSLDATAAWLCGMQEHWSPDLRSWVLRSRPEIHLRYGDPAALPLEYRRQALQRIATNYAGRGHAWIEADDQALARIATADLTEEINHLVLDASIVLEFRWQLLRMAALAKLTGCVDTALHLVATSMLSEDLRIEAVDVVVQAGGDAGVQRLAAVARALPNIGDSLAFHLVQALYPRHFNNTDLVTFASKVLEPELPTFPSTLARQLGEHLPHSEAGDLLSKFLELIQRPPHQPTDHGAIPLSQRFHNLRAVLPPITKVLLDAPRLSDAETEAVALALLFIGEVAHELEATITNDLATAAERFPAMRRIYFLRCIALTRASTGREPTQWYFHPFHHESLLKPTASDLDWLTHEIGVVRDAQRATLFHLAVNLWQRAGKPRAARKRIEQAIQDDPVLMLEFSHILSGLRTAPLRQWWYHNITFRIQQRWWWSRIGDRFTRHRRLWEQRFWLHWYLRIIASGTDANRLWWTLQHADERDRNRWTVREWDSLGRKFGPLVKRAAKRGCKRLWRRFTPCPPSAKPEPNRVDTEVIIGLTGIQAQLDDGEIRFAEFTDAEARTATLYAVNELNSPPSWLDKLAVDRPAPVAAALRECIEHEWSMPPDQIRVFGVLSKVLSRADTYGELVRPAVLELLRRSDPTQPTLLDFALRLVLPARPADLALLAQERVQLYSRENSTTALWTAAWLRLEPEPALTWLEGLPANDDAADRLVRAVCVSLHGGDLFRPVRDAGAAYLQPAALRRLIAIIYRRVRLADDITRDGSYTPNARDYAQEFRNSLVSALAEQRGTATTALLNELADDPFLAPIRDWILQRRDTHARQQTERAPWTPAAVREFAEANEAAPRNDEELYHIALKRLQDIKFAVELSDLSIRQALTAASDETALRRFMAAELSRRAVDRYTEPQEAVIDEERRPDIRLENPAVTGPISIEIKLTENWTVEQLLERLENQLVGTYLRPHDSRFGIFLLGMVAHGGKTRWHNPGGGQMLTFREVAALVRIRTQELQASTPGVRGLAVIDIDFRPPSQWV